MKITIKFVSINAWILSFGLCFASLFGVKSSYCAPIQTNNLNITFQQIADLARMKNESAEKVRMFSYEYSAQRKLLITELLKIFDDANASTLNRGMAAYYLGEMHAVEAIDHLVDKITLELGANEMLNYISLPLVYGRTSLDALVKIGTPSIPVIIKKLENTDDSNVIKLSLWVLYHIEGDKDIVQLRLQKALAAQTDPEKKARLQAALKSLADPQFK